MIHFRIVGDVRFLLTPFDNDMTDDMMMAMMMMMMTKRQAVKATKHS